MNQKRKLPQQIKTACQLLGNAIKEFEKRPAPADALTVYEEQSRRQLEILHLIKRQLEELS